MSEKLVCIMRVKDQADKLARCLRSMPFVDLFIIIDNGSSEDLEVVLRGYDYAMARTPDLNASRDLNLAYHMARERGADWCLWMDSDEQWEKRAADEFRDLLKPGPINGWIFRIFPFVLSDEFFRVDRNWMQFTAKGQLRLFRVQDGVHWNDPRPTHPGLPQGLKGAIRPSDLRIKHWTISSQEELERKLGFYAHDTDTLHFRDGGQGVYKKWIE